MKKKSRIEILESAIQEVLKNMHEGIDTTCFDCAPNNVPYSARKLLKIFVDNRRLSFLDDAQKSELKSWLLDVDKHQVGVINYSHDPQGDGDFFLYDDGSLLDYSQEGDIWEDARDYVTRINPDNAYLEWPIPFEDVSHLDEQEIKLMKLLEYQIDVVDVKKIRDEFEDDSTTAWETALESLEKDFRTAERYNLMGLEEWVLAQLGKLIELANQSNRTEILLKIPPEMYASRL